MITLLLTIKFLLKWHYQQNLQYISEMKGEAS